MLALKMTANGKGIASVYDRAATPICPTGADLLGDFRTS
jgi:hypothetical protein